APPENKPTPAEIATCRPFLSSRIEASSRVAAILALGSIAHDSVLRAHGVKPTFSKFGHAVETELPTGKTLVSSYHCSRYNTQTRRLTTEMFEAVMTRAKELAFRA
ncbi:MAG: uracil-DNA glycosylase family protein, partial [Terricaulis sp.]